MAYDDNELLQKWRKYSDHDEDRSELYGRVELEIALYSPEYREQMLRQLDDDMTKDASLRHRSQMISLHRRLSDTHDKLKLAGR